MDASLRWHDGYAVEAGPSAIGWHCIILDIRVANGIYMRLLIVRFCGLILAISVPAHASDVEGPARFCGYSPIIDLLPGEKITTLEGGIHGGSFRWEGAFGVLEVHGIGWASRPRGRIIRPSTSNHPIRFAQRRAKNGFRIAIWNGSHGAAYFSSPRPFTAPQLDAIDRVELFEEGQTPSNCKLRTFSSWE